jgi:hypothetical protein
VLGDAVNEMLPVGAAAKIGERQHDDGEAQRAGFFGAGSVRISCRRRADFKRKDPDRIDYILEFFRAEIAAASSSRPFTWR